MKYLKTHKLIVAAISFHIAIFFSPFAHAQEPLHHQPERYLLRLMQEQYDQGHYALARQTSDRYLQLPAKFIWGDAVQNKSVAQYYQTLSLLKLHADGAADSAMRYLEHTVNPNFKQRTSLALAQYYFETKQYPAAIAYYESVNNLNMTNQEIVEMKFQLGYCYFYDRKFDKAAPLFETIKGLGGRYAKAGNYYNGILAYNQGKYEEAMTCFKRIDSDPEYVSVVPFYEAEILYFTGKHTEALAQSKALMAGNPKSYYDNELHLLAAQILFEAGKYADAIPYFEHYYDQSEEIRKEVLYEMAYSYYQNKQWKNAIEKFRPLSTNEDSLGQSVLYLLGDAYLHIADKKSARNAFGVAGNMNYNPNQQELSLLTYGKLSYEMGFANDALQGLSSLVKLFPHSPSAATAKTILSSLLLRTNNFEDAYNTLKEADKTSPEYAALYQKITYGYALQLLQQGRLTDAATFLDYSLQRPVHKNYELAALFWKGDIAYRNGQYQEAYSYSKRFVDANSNAATYISSAANLANATTNMGYAAMKLNDFATAQVAFNKVQQQATASQNTALATNALIREADALFMMKNYKAAVALYDKIIAANTDDADYARLQKAIIAGANQNNDEKIKILQQMVAQTPPSAYAGNARYELGITYMEEDRYQAAIIAFKPLLDGVIGKEYALKARMKTAFAYQQLNKNNEAIETYKYIVTNYPASEEKQDALVALRSLYIENNQPEAYAALLKENNIQTDINPTLDSTYYATAEAQIASGKWAEAKQTLSNYLTKFPNGVFTTKAHYYLAESCNQLKDYDNALKHFDEVLRLPWNEFSENSAKQAAGIAFSRKQYAAAQTYYQQLRNTALTSEHLQSAYNGMMRSTYFHKDFKQAITFADTLLLLPELEAKMKEEALYYKSRSLHHMGLLEEAGDMYAQLSKAGNPTFADEAKYRMAEILFSKDKLTEAETQAASVIKSSSGNNYWVVKSYLLLADILTRQKDYFNAKATLQSIIKNTKFDDMKQEAITRLNIIKEIEKKQSKVSGK